MDFDAYTDPEAEELLLSAAARRDPRPGDHRPSARRALRTELSAAGLFLAGALGILLAGHSARPFSFPTVLIVTVAYLVAARVQFPVGPGWCRPTQVVFVAMLFLVPLAVVPILVTGCLLFDFVLPPARGRFSTVRLGALVADAGYSVGPVLVLLLAHEQSFAIAHWPVYLLAFVVQIAFDLGPALTRAWFAERIRPSRQPQMAWSVLTDAALSCGGLLVAAASVHAPGMLLLSLPLIGLLGLFARERQERMDNTLELSTAYRGTAMLLGDVIEGDDEYTGVHSREVVELALAVATALGLDARAKRDVEFGALLHDVGKIRVPKEIIHKPDALDDDEWEVMRMHTVFGEEMLARVGGTLSGVGRIVRASHERFDGTGYPDRLAGEAIPIEARIVSACDSFNAMTTDRPYRRAMSHRAAVAELVRCTGTHFDPRVVAALIDVIDEPLAPDVPPLPSAVLA